MEFILKNVQVLYGEQLELTDDAIWVKDGYIYKVLPEDELPENVQIYDGAGKYVLPGLIDLHVHMMWDGSLNPVATLEAEGYEQMLIRAVSYCRKYLQHGITTVRDIGSVDDIALHVAKAINRGLIEGPSLIASGKTLTMTGGHDPFWARFVDGTEEALKGVREQIFKGAEVIKLSSTGGVYGRTEGEEVGHVELNLDEQQVICNEAHKFGLKVSSHAIGREGIYNSIVAGVDTIEHGHFLDHELVSMMEDRGTAWIPTLYVYQQIAEQEGIPDYAKRKAEEIVDIHAKAFKQFFDRNILVGAGSDAGSPMTPHPTLQEELKAMNALVDDTKEILKTATVNAGKILGRNVGQIEENYVADLVLLDANPLDNLDNLKGVQEVYKKGKLFS